MNILGLSCYYHDSAACLLKSGEILAAAQEERFSRTKHDPAFPHRALQYCLAEGGISADGLDAVVFYDKPLRKFHRILETFLSHAPQGLAPYLEALPAWVGKKLWTEPNIQEALSSLGAKRRVPVYYTAHHESHAASAFYPSPFPEAAIITVDGVGEWATTTVALGKNEELEILEELHFPHSLGLLYSAFTSYLGFRVNSGEYKLMGLAPYGEPTYAGLIKEKLLDLKADGSFRLNLEYFSFPHSLVMVNQTFEKLFGGPPRQPDGPLSQRVVNLASSIQQVTEDILLRLAHRAKEITGQKNLCLAGGVALNAVANGKILRSKMFDDIWIQPCAGDAGGALGAACRLWYTEFQGERTPSSQSMKACYLGPRFSDEEIEAFLQDRGYAYQRLSETSGAQEVAELLSQGLIVGWFQGRMEFGPRALGNRSILADPRSSTTQTTLNLKIKNRESFRPFAPSCLEEDVAEYFELDRPAPYMTLVTPVRASRLLDTEPTEDPMSRLQQRRSDIPSVTHVDNTARVQTVSAKDNPKFHRLLSAFKEKTGYAVLLNTSFNVRGEPIVCTPEEAYDCFAKTQMDVLVLGCFLLTKEASSDQAKSKVLNPEAEKIRK